MVIRSEVSCESNTSGRELRTGSVGFNNVVNSLWLNLSFPGTFKKWDLKLFTAFHSPYEKSLGE